MKKAPELFRLVLLFVALAGGLALYSVTRGAQTPGLPNLVDRIAKLTSTALTFLKGHRVRVIISSSNYPKYALNLNDGGPMYRKGAGMVATNTVYADKQRPSGLILPVVAR
jgi:predicted acyl esterase